MNALIFGATSVIAAEVAVILARRRARLHLVGRDSGKLRAVATRCVGSQVTTECADFARLDDNHGVVCGAIAALGQIDLALIAHGDVGDQLASEHDFAEAEAIIRVNFTSVVSLLVPLANHMETARSGTIGVITSVAGERGRRRNYTYGAAKGALNLYLQGLRTRLGPSGVGVTTLKLGPVDTPMTEGHPKHALFGRAPSVAVDIVQALDARVPEAYVPSFWRLLMPLVRNAPESLLQSLPFRPR